MGPTLDIVIVNWNSGNLVSECIDSIGCSLNNKFELQRVVVVDNASVDDSISNIKNEDLPLKIIKNSVNVGFGKACNQGAKGSNADYLLFLNPDTKLERNSLSNSLTFFSKKENSNIGILGIKQVNEFGEINQNCARFPTPFSMISRSFGIDKLFPKLTNSHFMTEWDHDSNRIVDQVMGSFYLIRKDLFEMLGGYDERFFVYYEDLDLSLRAKKKGFSSFYLAETEIFHKGHGTTESVKSIRLFYNLRSKIIYAKKHFNVISYFFITLTILLFEPIARIIFALSKGNISTVKEILEGYKMLIEDILYNKAYKDE